MLEDKAETEVPEGVDDDVLATSRKLRAYGFVGGAPVYSSAPLFDIDEFKAAFFDSTLIAPLALSVKLSETIIEVYVSMVRAIFAPDTSVVLAGQPQRYYEEPDWYFEGWVFGGYDGRDVDRVHWPVRGFVSAMPLCDSGIDEVSIQLAPDGPDEDLIIEIKVPRPRPTGITRDLP